MRRSKSEIYLYAVWATHKRESLLTRELQARLYAFIKMQTSHLHCSLLAINGMPDHMHIIIRLPTTVCAAQLMKQVKGASSAYMNDITGRTPFFRWQEGSGTFSLCEPILTKAILYIENQEHHHKRGPLWLELEQTDEETTATYLD